MHLKKYLQKNISAHLYFPQSFAGCGRGGRGPGGEAEEHHLRGKKRKISNSGPFFRFIPNRYHPGKSGLVSLTCFFLYSSIVRNFSCSAWNSLESGKNIFLAYKTYITHKYFKWKIKNYLTTSPPLSMFSSFSLCSKKSETFQAVWVLTTLTWGEIIGEVKIKVSLLEFGERGCKFATRGISFYFIFRDLDALFSPGNCSGAFPFFPEEIFQPLRYTVGG